MQNSVLIYLKQCLLNYKAFGRQKLLVGHQPFNFKRHLNCVLLNNRPHQAIPTLVDIHSNETLFYPFTVIVNKRGGSCNTISEPYAQVRVPHKVKKYECNSI